MPREFHFVKIIPKINQNLSKAKKSTTKTLIKTEMQTPIIYSEVIKFDVNSIKYAVGKNGDCVVITAKQKNPYAKWDGYSQIINDSQIDEMREMKSETLFKILNDFVNGVKKERLTFPSSIVPDERFIVNGLIEHDIAELCLKFEIGFRPVLISSKDKHEKQIKYLSQDIKKLQNGHDELRKNHNKVKADCDDVQYAHFDLQKDHNKLRKDHDELKIICDELRNDNNKLNDKVDKLSAKLNELEKKMVVSSAINNEIALKKYSDEDTIIQYIEDKELEAPKFSTKWDDKNKTHDNKKKSKPEHREKFVNPPQNKFCPQFVSDNWSINKSNDRA